MDKNVLKAGFLLWFLVLISLVSATDMSGLEDVFYLKLGLVLGSIVGCSLIWAGLGD